MSIKRQSQDSQQDQANGPPIFNFLFGLLDRIFKDNATGEILASRVIVIIILFAMALLWFKWDSFSQIYKDSSYENYEEIVQHKREKKFDSVLQEQLQIIHISSGADFSAVYLFRPKNFNYFVDLGLYEGKLPESVDSKNLGGYPIDKTSTEYTTHLTGQAYESSTEFTYLPTQELNKQVKYMYSCPFFNMDNVYSGSIAMYWYNKPLVSKARLFAVCNQSARVIGRAK